MQWIAHFSDGETVERDGHIYHSIKHKLRMLMHLSVVYNGHTYTVNLMTGVLSINDNPIDVCAMAFLHDIRPICFNQWTSELDTETGRKLNQDNWRLTGVGWQGTDNLGNNKKRYIAIYPDGSHKLVIKE